MQKSPLYFIEKMWGLTPQPLLPEFSNLIDAPANTFTPEHFGKFIKGKHLTWQQWLIVRSVEWAIQNKAKKRISIRSGHGIAKSCSLALIVLWYLFCFKDAQVPCTAPTSDQMYDVLWKEISKWLTKMPKPIREKYEYQSGYVRITESPETWFARAKTARKEAPEALAGIHGDFVLMIVDEASGVPQEIFNTAEGALTNENILVIMASNPTRLVGYFYDSHNQDSRNWQTLRFDSRDSPIVDASYIQRIIDKHGEDSDEYRIRVMGEFPREDAVDDQGYVPLLTMNDLKYTNASEFTGRRMMGIDPSGEGDDETKWVVRDEFKAKIVATEKISNPKSIAQKTLTLMEFYEVKPEDIIVDNFGEGANVALELAKAGNKAYVNGVNVGDQATDSIRYINKRAEGFWRLKEWLRRGGELFNHKDWEELLTIRYRRELSGKLKIMSKEDMRKAGYRSPNSADALMLTFFHESEIRERSAQFKRIRSQNSDPYDI